MKKILMSVIMVTLISCGSFKAQRVDNKTSDEKSMEITDNWMGEDTRLAVKTLISQMEKHRGFKRVMKNHKGVPKVFIAEVQNSTSEAYFPIDDLFIDRGPIGKIQATINIHKNLPKILLII